MDDKYYKGLSVAQLGHNINYNEDSEKLELKVDNDTLKSDNDGVVSVDKKSVTSDIKVVDSADEDNAITGNSTTGANLTKTKIKTIVGEMVASATDGIDYDGVNKALKAHITDMAVTDSNSVDLTLTDDNGDVAIKGDIKISSASGNHLSVRNDGLYIDADKIDMKTYQYKGDSNPYFRISVTDNDNITIPLVAQKNANGDIVGYLIKP